MPECASTGCRRERFTFFAFFFTIGAVRLLRVLSMFCLVEGTVEPRKPACELESLEAF